MFAGGGFVNVPAGSGGPALGELLKQHRLACGLSQEELGELAGVSVRAIGDIERGRTTRPYRKTVGLLAAALGIQGQQGELLSAARRAGAVSLPAERPSAVGLPAERPYPRGLPAPVPQFAGRGAELKALDALLDRGSSSLSGPALAIISGAAGMGKSTLAVYWAQQVCGDFPDGQLYLNLRGFDTSGKKVTPAEAIRILLDGLGVPSEQIPASLEAQAGLYRSTLAGKRALVVLDNVRDADQVAPLLPGSPGCLTLITSRNQLAGLIAAQGAYLLTLGVLSSAEARELLARRVGGDPISSQPRAVDEIISRCGRLPLALAIVAARVALRPADPLGLLAAELGGPMDRLSALDVGDPSGSVRAVFSWSYRDLSEAAARMFRLLGLHPGPDISIPAAASLAAVPAHQARELLRDLSRLNMVTEQPPWRYSLHDLMRAYAAELVHAVESGHELCLAQQRMFDYYLHAAWAAALIVHPTARLNTPASAHPQVVTEEFTSSPEAMAWFQSERSVLLAIIAQASQPGLGAYAAELPAAMRDFLEYGGHWADIVLSQQAALLAAVRQGNLAGQARAHRGIAYACILLDALDDAEQHTRAAIDLCQRLGDKEGEGRAHLCMSCIRGRQRRFEDGIKDIGRALDLFGSAGDRAGEAAALTNLGTQQAATGDYPAAAESCRQGIALHRELKYSLGVADGMDSLGCAYHGLGQYGAAIDCFRAASALFEEAGARRYEAVVLSHLGDACRAAGDLAEATAAWTSAQDIFDELHDGAAQQVRAKLSQLTHAEGD